MANDAVNSNKMRPGKVRGGGGKDDQGQGYQTQMPSGARQVN